jgi:hypothetical protein
MNTEELKGYGVEIQTTANVKAFEEILNQTTELKQNIKEIFDEWEIDEATEEDYFEYDCDNCIGIPYLLAQAINEIEGTTSFVAVVDDITMRKYIIFLPALPFEYNEKERNLSNKDLDALFNKYIYGVYGEVTISKKTINIFE